MRSIRFLVAVFAAGVLLVAMTSSCASQGLPAGRFAAVTTSGTGAAPQTSVQASETTAVVGVTDTRTSDGGGVSAAAENSSTTSVAPPKAAVIVDPAVGTSVAIGSGDPSMVFAGGLLWVATSDDPKVTAYGPTSMTVAARFEHPGTKRMFVQSDRTFQACSDTDSVTIEPGSAAVVSTIPVGCPSGATGDNGFWSQDSSQLRFVESDGQIFFAVDVGHPGALSLSGSSVWVADSEAGPGEISRVAYGPRQVVATVSTPAPTSSILATPSAVWATVDAAGPGDVSLLEIDPLTNTVVATYSGGVGVGAVDVSGHYVWAAYADGTVLVVDADTHEVVRTITVPAVADPPPSTAVSLVSAAGAVFVAGHGTLTRIDTGSFGGSASGTVGPVRATVSGGCPRRVPVQVVPGVGVSQWFTNTDQPELHERMVPGKPTAALVCRYSELTFAATSTGSIGYSGGTLIGSVTVDAGGARGLAEAANSIPAAMTHGGLGVNRGPLYTLLVFASPGFEDTDVGIVDDSHPATTNGYFDGEGASFGPLKNKIDALLPPAPNRTSE
jgi:hypothetical protein